MSFPTLLTQSGHQIPIHPQPGIFETTIAVLDGWPEGETALITPDEIEKILARPPWDFEEADLRLTGERIAALQVEVAAAVRKPPAKKAAAKKRPAKKTAKKTAAPKEA